ncbi:DUF1015 domain-containing protein [Streptomyces sp. F63]|uniref:DUF1015 family protein n=1 Tax=Streptomyces sp. F63 TaxID=2824887 RepID=UPI001B364496|nr:DUF1015 domain-containing protein [Streptomyces sp. F63]MBQ0987634.1 DUF1015 domain-containing protein [Streptomyces sp. F63]
MSRTGPTRDGLRLSPFRGLRYAPERVSSLAAVTSPPYDVVVRPDGLRHLETADPYNIVRLILPHGDSPAVCHRRAGETLRRWRAEGVLRADPEPALYVYEQYGEGLLQRGLIGALRLSPPGDRVVLPHEDVMPDVVADRTALMRATAANLEPLLLTYRSDETEDGHGPHGATAVIERAVRRTPLLTTTTEDGRRHRLWAVTDPAELTEVDADLGRRQALIADGHHRWATYLRLREEQPAPGPWDSGLVLLVDTARHPLRVRAIHRLLPRLPLPEALDALRGAFRVRRVEGPLPNALKALNDPADSPEPESGTARTGTGGGTGNAFLLTGGDGSFHLVDHPDPALLARTVPGGRPRAWRTLDATVLHSVLLGRIWEVPDDPEHIRYIHDAAAAVEQVDRHGGTAVLMRPVREETVRQLAQQGVMMPRKSTSFGPKPATGLVLRSLDTD